MNTRKLTSKDATFIKNLVRLNRARDAERLFVLEGHKPIRELLTSHASYFQGLIVTEENWQESGEPLWDAIQSVDCPVYLCPMPKFAAFSDLTTPSGMLAILRQPTWNQEAVFRRRHFFGFYGESLQDPTNVGTLIRTAAAFGLDGLWLSPDSVDVFNPKVVRATAGALLTLPIFIAEDATMLTERGCAIVTAELPGPHSTPLDTIAHIPPRSVVALGNESRGLSQSVINLATLRFHIAIRPEADSLNVATSAAIAAFHFKTHCVRR